MCIAACRVCVFVSLVDAGWWFIEGARLQDLQPGALHQEASPAAAAHLHHWPQRVVRDLRHLTGENAHSALQRRRILHLQVFFF